MFYFKKLLTLKVFSKYIIYLKTQKNIKNYLIIFKHFLMLEMF